MVSERQIPFTNPFEEEFEDAEASSAGDLDEAAPAGGFDAEEADVAFEEEVDEDTDAETADAAGAAFAEPSAAARATTMSGAAARTGGGGAVPGAEPDWARAEVDLDKLADAAGGPWAEREEDLGSVGRTMFDTPSSDDDTVTVLLPRECIGSVPSQALVRICSREDGRKYLGVVVKGPYAEPDGLRADAPVIVTTSVRGATFMPHFHGRIQVELLGEEIEGGLPVPQRFRPLPNSPVFLLTDAETKQMLKLGGNLRLGLAVGHENLEVAIPTDTKAVLPRHLGILGTTGGGKSTTVAGMIAGLQRNNAAVIIFDTEGEYTEIGAPTEDAVMQAALLRCNLARAGVPNTMLYHLYGRETANPSHPQQRAFSLKSEALSPYALMEILDLNEAQQDRFLRAYDVLKALLRQRRIYPASEAQNGNSVLIDELEEGWPEVTLVRLYDTIAACAARVDKQGEQPYFHTTLFRDPETDKALSALLHEKGSLTSASSWRALQGKIGRIHRLKIFDNPNARPLDCAEMLQPGRVSIIDLSDTDSPVVRNLAIAEILRGVLAAQDAAYETAVQESRPVTPVGIFIEEAHEFLSAERIKSMPNLFAQVARIARRGRKRWLGLAFVTQLPQHLPHEVIGLLNNFVLHKISDASVISDLRRQLGGIDESLWKRLPTLAPGQAIVSFTPMARPLLVAINPAPCKLRMVD